PVPARRVQHHRSVPAGPCGQAGAQLLPGVRPPPRERPDGGRPAREEDRGDEVALTSPTGSDPSPSRTPAAGSTRGAPRGQPLGVRPPGRSVPPFGTGRPVCLS